MKPDFQRSTETLALIDRLKAASIGEVVTYAAMSDVIGADIQTHRHYLVSAIKTLYGDGIPFGTVRNEGVKRLEAGEVVMIGDHAIRHIKRTARTARKRIGSLSGMNDVPNDVRVRANGASALLGVIEHFSTGESKKAAIKQAEVAQGVIPPRKLLEALK